jgi:hypothetical protein
MISGGQVFTRGQTDFAKLINGVYRASQEI